jgi:hypothetical protein
MKESESNTLYTHSWGQHCFRGWLDHLLSVQQMFNEHRRVRTEKGLFFFLSCARLICCLTLNFSRQADGFNFCRVRTVCRRRPQSVLRDGSKIEASTPIILSWWKTFLSFESSLVESVIIISGSFQGKLLNNLWAIVRWARICSGMSVKIRREIRLTMVLRSRAEVSNALSWKVFQREETKETLNNPMWGDGVTETLNISRGGISEYRTIMVRKPRRFAERLEI